MNMGNRGMKNMVVNKTMKGWNRHRAQLDFAQKTFNELWRQQRQNNAGGS
jgi:L-lactate dehydrogenase complex protein LldF